MMSENKILGSINKQSDSVVITNYDQHDRKIGTTVIEHFKSPVEDDDIPDEDNGASTSSYILPKKQI